MNVGDLMVHPVVRGAVAGAVAAAAIDVAAFRSFKTFTEFQAYDWRIAAVRWAQGAVVGALAALGFAAVV